MSDIEIVKGRREWKAVRGGSLVTAGRTRAEVLANLDRIAWLAEQERLGAERAAAWLAERGLAEIDYRELRAGDSYICSPPLKNPPVRVALEVQHFVNGVTFARHSLTRVEEVTCAPPCMLFVPDLPAYGSLRGRG